MIRLIAKNNIEPGKMDYVIDRKVFQTVLI